jgi:8-oxo-dGTP pyrophosphatase MutT (NUDIX family)
VKLNDLIRDPDKLKKATLCFLIKDNKLLLAMKKRGFGVGKWNGVGGKIKNGESIEGAAVRETMEEIGVIIRKLKKVAVLNFYFEENPEWDQNVTTFLVEDWVGEPKESEEMKPKWFSINKIPYKKMWWDDILWLPKVINGKCIEASFLFNNKEKVTDQIIVEREKLE